MDRPFYYDRVIAKLCHCPTPLLLSLPDSPIIVIVRLPYYCHCPTPLLLSLPDLFGQSSCNLDWCNFNWTLLCHCEESSFRIYHSPVSDGGGLTTGA
jgi:hypothetical protein